MKWKVKEGQIVIAGRIGMIEKKSDSFFIVSIANRFNKDDTKWEHVAFASPKNGDGYKYAELAEKYMVIGQYITVVCNERENGEYKNLYATAVELGPKPSKNKE